MVADAEKYPKEDEEAATRISVKNGLELYMYNFAQYDARREVGIQVLSRGQRHPFLLLVYSRDRCVCI
jgi:hypothetical protein